ncbi:MAG: dihydrofolate reductase [Myxococcota bacterium]|nr:dihydrofolate reductase [Myxococcota bacterium]
MTLIAAMDMHGLIGHNNALPWSLPADLKYFRKMTLGKPVIMGRKTFQSIGRPLPKRRNIVLSRRLEPGRGFEVFGRLNDAMSALQSVDDEMMIIGGAQVYRDALLHAQKMLITIVQHTFEGDTYFPRFDGKAWSITARDTRPADDKNAYACEILTLERGLHGEPLPPHFPGADG